MKIYCTAKDNNTRHPIAHKISQHALSLQDSNFKIHFIERVSPVLDDAGDTIGSSTWHGHNELDIDILLDRQKDS